MLTSEGRRGQLTRAAEALNCQRSYLSRVISEKLQITPDHAFKLSRFWRLKLEEKAYFQLLVEHDRSVDADYRNHLKSQINEMREKHSSIQERTQRTSLSTESIQANYFSNWIWSAIHFLTSIPEFQSVASLCDRLGLKKETVVRYLRALAEQGFVENKNGRWIYKVGEFHIPKNSHLVVLHHQNWRNRAVLDAQNAESSSIHFTGVHTLSVPDYERLRELLLTFLEEANQIAGPSESQEAVALTCDLFRI